MQNRDDGISENLEGGREGGGEHCVLKCSFTWTFLRNQDATLNK